MNQVFVASSFIWRVILSFLKLLVTSISSHQMEILSVKAPYKGMSSFQRGKDNNRVEMLLYLKIGIAKVCSKFDGVYYLIMNVIAVFMETFIVVQQVAHNSMLACGDE